MTLKRNKKKKHTLALTAFIIILLAVCFFTLPKYAAPKKYSECVEKYAAAYGIDENLIYSVIKAESNFDKFAVSPKGASGLMQLMESTAVWVAGEIGLENFKTEELFDEDVNINIGTWYLSFLINRYDNIETALAAYNAGNGTVDKWLSDSSISPDGQTLVSVPYKETETYVKRVLFYKKLYESMYR